MRTKRKKGNENERTRGHNPSRRDRSGRDGFALTEGEDQQDQLRQVGKASRRHQRAPRRHGRCGQCRP